MSETGIEAGIEAKVAFLARRVAYPEYPPSVEVVETHMSWVFLTQEHAYKLKKPARSKMRDFSTVERRREGCAEELRLNRRLAPDVYLGLVRLTRGDDRKLALDGPGETIDWLVWMRRLPADRMLDALMTRGKLEHEDVQPAARLLARFYGSLPPAPISGPELRERLAEAARGHREALGQPRFGLPGPVVHQIAESQLDYLDRHAKLFDERVAAGHVVEGHGDLRPEHVCLLPQPVIIDCLEFSKALRIVDAADELAFLALECERLGRSEVGDWFLETYSRESGDEPPDSLLRFFRSRRALERAKLAAWHLDDPDVRDPERWRQRALRYLERVAPGGGEDGRTESDPG